MTALSIFRANNPLCFTHTYLASAFHNGGTISSRRGIDRYFTDCEKYGAHAKKSWNATADETRKLACLLVGGESSRGIAFTKNTVEGLNLIARAFPWQKGDNIVVSDQEHTSNLMPWLALKDIGVECRVVKAESYSPDVDNFAAVVDEHTRMIAVSHVQASTGYTCDLEALGSFCRRKGIFLVVDAIQSLGLLPFKAEEWGVSAVSCGGHKALLAVPGIGILYVSPALLSILKPQHAGSSGAMTIDREKWENVCLDPLSALKLEQSNLNYPGIYALNEGLSLIVNAGIEPIADHIASLSTLLYKGLEEIGYTIVTPADPAHRAGIISVSVPDPDGMRDFMAENNVAVSRMDAGFVRFSLAACSNDEDVAAALRAAKRYYDSFISSK
ncbi:MAG: aminotransferase class V-fold PLP-dependent enzyme [Clostridia bacterium]|nr:aminotransferase class V-fold PLP-dependent enzyme [Clostridia bacterium]